MPIKWREFESPHLPPDCVGFVAGKLHVFVGREPVQGAWRWHLSISHPSRYPTWDEIHDARYALVPDGATMAMLLPPKSQYVNLHNFCFHLYEIEGEPSLRASRILVP